MYTEICEKCGIQNAIIPIKKYNEFFQCYLDRNCQYYLYIITKKSPQISIKYSPKKSKKFIELVTEL